MINDMQLALRWLCPCDNGEELRLSVALDSSMPYEHAEMIFRAAWEDFHRERLTHAAPQKS